MNSDPAAPLIAKMDELCGLLRQPPPAITEADLARIAITSAQGAATAARGMVIAWWVKNLITVAALFCIAAGFGFAAGFYLGKSPVACQGATCYFPR